MLIALWSISYALWWKEFLHLKLLLKQDILNALKSLFERFFWISHIKAKKLNNLFVNYCIFFFFVTFEFFVEILSKMMKRISSPEYFLRLKKDILIALSLTSFKYKIEIHFIILQKYGIGTWTLPLLPLSLLVLTLIKIRGA